MRRLTIGVVIALTAGAIAFAPGSVGATNLAAPIRLQQVATGLDSPVAFAWRNGRSSPIYVAQQSGSLVTVAHGHVTSTLLTVSVSHGNEQGLLGIAFSRDGKKLYIDYTDPKGDIHIVEYTMNGNLVNKNTRRQLMMIPHHSADNHNGGNLVIGPDNMLYISVGDGGGGGDTFHNGQNKTSLLAKILRINPKPSGSHPFTIPSDNPWANKPYTKAMWMWGLRNPWRFSFDRKTHDMWIGDVGQDAWEEIDYAKAGQKGINWGWPLREGKHPYDGARPPGARDPIFERSHNDGDCAIIGGYVYRGSAIPGFQGAYVFGDECTGELRAITQSAGHLAGSRDLNLNVSQLSTFGEGPQGEIYAASLGGTLYVLQPK
jgi:glucose/arabinose dehydrogenase